MLPNTSEHQIPIVVVAALSVLLMMTSCDRRESSPPSGPDGQGGAPGAGSAGPDLAVTGAHAEVRPKVPETIPVDVRFTIINHGGAPAGPFRLTVWIQHQQKNLYYQVTDEHIDGLGPGQERPFHKTSGVHATDPGPHTLNIRIDPLNNDDANPQNNNQEHAFVVPQM